MNLHITRRDMLKAAAVLPLLARQIQADPPVEEAPMPRSEPRPEPGWVVGKMTGADALVETLIAEGTCCVFGIPGAQENELWDAMKSKGLGYLLCTHEFSASTMADGAARATGRPGVMCVVPGPGLTNSLSGIGEALLDSIPMVCIVGDVARGDKYHFAQVHELPQVGILQQVTKAVFEVEKVEQIPMAVRQAFHAAMCGEPGPAAVVVPYNLLIEACNFHSGPIGMPDLPFDDAAFQNAMKLLCDRKLCWGIYAGLGCMDHSQELIQAAEILQAPVATTISGKGVIPDCHPLAVGYGYGAFGTHTAEQAFKHLDGVLAIGVRYSEVATAFYSMPMHKHVIQVDINPNNLGRNVKPDVSVCADSGLFLGAIISHQDQLRRPCDKKLVAQIDHEKKAEYKKHWESHAKCGVDPMIFLLTLRQCLCEDALVFMDVTQSEHWGSEAFQVYHPRTYFNPADNQAMGWSIPAALGAQRVVHGKQVVTVTGDGCFLMSAMEISTAGREGLPVKFFVLDDQAYHYMQTLQKSAYLRTTATILARMNYADLAKGLGVQYAEIQSNADVRAGIQCALGMPGPVLVRVVTDYNKRPCRWIDSTKKKYTQELSSEQKRRFLHRIGSRAVEVHKLASD